MELDPIKIRRVLLAVIEKHPSDWSDSALDLISNSTLELNATNEKYDDNGILRLDFIISTSIETYESFEDLELIYTSDEIKYWMNEILPSNCGYKVKYLDIVPSMDDESKDAKDIILNSVESEKLNVLAMDLLENGKRMSQAYVILYCLENLLRDFIDKTLTKYIGEDFENKIFISNDVKKNAKSRKNDESKKAWLPLRGDKLVFYLDFKDLGDVIANNWESFKTLFPNQPWIKSKIDELYDIRNLVAHNSLLNDTAFKALEVDYEQIVQQLGYIKDRKR